MCCVFLDPKNSRLRRAPTKPGFLKRFTGIGTRFCYSQNDLVAARMQFHVFSRVYERASTIRKNNLDVGSRTDAGLVLSRV